MGPNKTALITGITGQDGSYLTELLLEKSYVVHGLVRRSSTTTIRRLITRIQPDEMYHLAGQSHVGLSFDIPESTCELTAMCTLQTDLVLGDIEAERDWGDARDFVEAMWLALQHEQAGDYVKHDDRYERPHDVSHLLGNAAKAREMLGWLPQHGFDDLVRDMVETDIELSRRQTRGRALDRD